jgi:hypothetical protein
MRARTIALFVAILLVAGLAALNWSEIVRPVPLLLGPVMVQAPLGLILLGLLALTLVLFLASTIALRTQSLLDYRQQQKALETQRQLADQAEASRFATLQTQLEQVHRSLGARLEALEGRLEARLPRPDAGAALPADAGSVAPPQAGGPAEGPGEQPPAASGWRKWF